MAFDDLQRCRDLIDTGRLADALVVARRVAKAQPGAAGRALLLEVLATKGEHAAVATEISALERAHPGDAAVGALKKRFGRAR